MKGRRTVAWLCVLLGHAWLLFLMIRTGPTPERTRPELETAAITLFPLPEPPVPPQQAVKAPAAEATLAPEEPAATTAPEVLAGESGAITLPGHVDWPLEGKKAAARVLAEEAEAERVARMFSGPKGTWSSLTRRERDQLNHFRWAPGVDGLERDERGNTIYTFKSGCVLVNFSFIGCPIGAKPPAYGDLFKDMRLYFDEQRRPATQDGNGTEPESMRPPKWSKPLGEKKLPPED